MFNKNPYLIPQGCSSRFDVNGVFSGQYLGGDHPCAMGNSTLPRKETAKKDRHSKIYTAQGPRDRRVRLSIGIARKFFDLQEMLGFDKPSKTLDWLLTKSKAAIRDLVQSKQKTAADSPSECEIQNGGGGGGDSRKKKDKGAPHHQTTSSYHAKESRVKARARARERTKEKMCIKQLNGATNINGCNSYNENGRFREGILHCPSLPPNEAANLIQESVMIKLKTKSPSFFGFQQNGVVSSSNYIIPSANSTDNWDVCNFNSQSNLYAILDHHKFINSNSNI